MNDLPTPLRTGRIAAIDVFRALTMFLMLFVNDIPSLTRIPHWLLHARIDEDMMGFSDVIFPAFLFCMGASVVLAIEHRYRKGDNTLQVISHVAGRTLALVVMGLFTLNCTGFDGGISYAAFLALMVLGFFLVWAVYPAAQGTRKHVFTAMKCAGAALLLFLVVYCDLHGKPFKVGWWGILGLIGWTYAVCCVIYIFTRYNLVAMTAVWAVVVLLAVVNHSALIPEGYGIGMLKLTFIPSDWTLHALGVSGMLCTLLMLRFGREAATRRTFYAVLVAGGAAMLALAVWSHNYWIISKIQATPTWLFYCLAMFMPLFALLYWLTDVRGKESWFAAIRPAGTSTLTCYILPYLWLAAMIAFNLSYPEALSTGLPGIVRSLVYSLIVVQIAGLMARIGVKIKV